MRLPSDRYDGPPPYDPKGDQARLLAIWKANPFHADDACYDHNNKLIVSILSQLKDVPTKQFIDALAQLLYGLYVYEGLYNVPPPEDYHYDRVDKEQLYLTHTARLAEADRMVRGFFSRFFRQMKPELVCAEPGSRSVKLIELCQNPAQLVNDFFQFAYCQAFPKTQKEMFDVLAWESNLNPSKLSDNPKYKWPKDSDRDPLDLVNTYLRGTPFQDILRLKVRFEIPEDIRFRHVHCVAGTGHGKSTLLTRFAIDDMVDPRQPAVIIIDGKGTWATALQRFKMFAPERELSKRLIILNPDDPIRPPALNPFQLPNVPESLRIRMIESIAGNLSYIFGERDFDLSAKQGTAFSYAAQLLFSMPNPTMKTMLDLMADPTIQDKDKIGGIPESSPFKKYIDALGSPVAKRFFYKLFYHPTEYQETKRQIQNRIFDLLKVSAFEKMFWQADNRLNMYDIMQTGKILIVDSSPGAVGEEAAPSLGKYIAASALSVAYARKNLPKSEWRPTYMYMDEAQMFVDEERTAPMLQQARDFRLGVILSHQKLADLETPALKEAFASNTATKYCGNPTHDDARDMAKEMRGKHDFVFNQPQGSFACYVHTVTPRPVSFSAEKGLIDDSDRMTDAQYAELIARNREMMSPRLTPPPTVEPLEVEENSPIDQLTPTTPERPQPPVPPRPRRRKGSAASGSW